MMRTRFHIPLSAPAALVLAALGAACGEVPVLEELSPEQTCRRTMHVGPVGVALEAIESIDSTLAGDTLSLSAPAAPAPPARPDVEWQGPRNEVEQHQLNAWCAAVAPAVFGGWAEPPAARVDSIAVVTWNVHVGGADLRRLVEDLRAGVFTSGRPVEHFVLLLQEAFREDDTLPRFDPGLPFGSAVSALPPSGERRDIVADAEDFGLSLFYAPSMRNGEGRGDMGEDRGNAILATLPLADPVAIELPIARQRRVAVAAAVVLGPGEDAPRLQVASVHLENDAAGLANDEAERLRQAQALLEGLPEADLAVAAGDFNTWSRGLNEALVDEMLEEYADTPPFPPGHTYERGFGFLRLYLDYIFYRVADDGRVRTIRIPDPYASDHFPLLGWVILPAPDS